MISEVKANEPPARYILSRSQFSRQKRIVKSSAFMPPPSKELSVFRIQDLSIEQIWEMGEEYVARPQQRNLYGRADVIVSIVEESGLQVKPDDNPPRHASITGWPDEKDRQKLTALELARQATLQLRDEDSP